MGAPLPASLAALPTMALRTPSIKQRFAGIGLLLGLAALAILLFQSEPKTSGVVEELVNRRPVGAARITADCRKAKWFHGTDSVRVVETTSRPDGSFSFQPSDIKGCDFLLVHPGKEGFKDAATIADSAISIPFEVSADVPSHLYLVRASEVTQLRLEGLFAQSNGVRVSPPGPMPAEDYLSVNSKFFESIRIASTKEEIRWVQLKYCDRLTQLWSKIPAEGQQTIPWKQYGNIVPHADVTAYCEKT